MSELFKGRSICGGVAEGPAIVTKQPMCFIGGVDVDSGVVTEVGHELKGQKLTGKVLVMPGTRGSAAGMYVIYRLSLNGLGPKAIVTGDSDTILIAATIMGGIPTVDQLGFELAKKFHTGDKIRVNGDKGTVEIL